MRLVAAGAAHELLIDGMVGGEGEVSAALDMTAVTQVRLRLAHNVIRRAHLVELLRAGDRVAIVTTHAPAVVFAAPVVQLGVVEAWQARQAFDLASGDSF
jgi:hypothetical protein